MTGIGWRLVNVVSQLLEHDECEAVRGDLEEAGESAWQALLDVLGLVIRRQAVLWKNWRPWLTAFGLAVPSTLLLMGFSLSVSRTYQQLIDAKILEATGLKMDPGVSLLMCRILLLIGWSWTGSFVVGSMSRRTVWVSAVLSAVASLFCFARYREESLSTLCLLLFLLPAIWGVRQGLRMARIRLSSAFVLAAAVTGLTIPVWNSGGPWILNWALSLPAWYMVAAARRHNGETS
jgi:hypothetical protein